MASTNFKLFDENKTNMMSDTEYNINVQRLNGVQAGIASSQLQNKTLHQTSLVAYSLAQIMMQNGYDANDSAAVSAFVGNMSNSLLQKVLDKATSVEAQAGTITNKWISPATMKAAALLLSGGTMSGPINMGNNKITNLADPTNSLDSANKKYVDESSPFKKVKVLDNQRLNFNGSTILNFSYPAGFTDDDIIKLKFVLLEFHNITAKDIYFGYTFGDAIPIVKSGSLRSYNNLQSLKILDYFYYSGPGSIVFHFRSGNKSTDAVEIRPTGEKYIKISSDSQTTGTVSAYFII